VFTGIFAGITWALETVFIAIALSMSPFVSSSEGLLLAPFISTFLHDTISSVYMLFYNIIKGNLESLLRICKTKNFKWLVCASAIGGPIGMTGYTLAVNFMGASLGAISCAIYPAIGALLAYVFLKERNKAYQWISLLITLIGVYGISYSPNLDIKNFWLGLLGAFMCAFGWGIEGVILSKCLKDGEVKSEYILQIRQIVSSLIYGIIIIPVIGGWRFTAGLFVEENFMVIVVILIAAFFATLSYLLYYETIRKTGVSKAMGLNITYTAWAVLFSIVILRDLSVLNPITIGCGIVVVVFGILSATDFKELLMRSDK